MKRIGYMILIVICCVGLIGCSQITKKTQDSQGSTSNSVKQTDDNSKVENSSEKPNGKISPTTSGQVVDDFEQFDQLNEENKSSLLYDYLVQSTLAIGNGEDGAKELLAEKSITSENASDLLPELEKLRDENPNDNFNQIMILLVQFVLEEKQE